MSEKKEKKDGVKVIPNDEPTDISNEQLEDLAKEAVKKFKSLG